MARRQPTPTLIATESTCAGSKIVDLAEHVAGLVGHAFFNFKPK